MSARASTSSKTLREAALHLTGYRERNVYGESFAVKQNITMGELLFRTDYVMKHEADVLRSQLARNRLDLINGNASFVDRNTLGIADDEGSALRTITADKIVIGVGTYSTAPPVVYADGRLIFVSDDVLNLPDLPRTLTVVGAGAIGLEYCCTFARARRARHARRARLALADVRGRGDRRHPHVRHASERSHVAHERGGLRHRVRHRRARQPRARHAREREADRERRGHVLRRAHRQHGVARPGSRGPGGRPARAPERGRALPDRGGGHLRGRRRDRLSGPRTDLATAGPSGRVPRVRRARGLRPFSELFPYNVQTIPEVANGRARQRPSSPSRESPTRLARRATASPCAA